MKTPFLLFLLIFFIFISYSCKPNKVKRINNCCEDQGIGANPDDSTYIFIPTAFSPNDDGVNDVYAPIVSSNISSFSLEIKFPGGVTVFETDNPDNHWTGIENQGTLDNSSGGQIVRSRSYVVNVQAISALGTEITIRSRVCVITDCKDSGDISECTFPDQLNATGIISASSEPFCQ